MRCAWLYLLPLPALRRLEYCVRDLVGSERVAERRRQRLAFRRSLDEIRELMREGVLVADLQARHPPVLHVRLVAVGDVNVAPAAHATFVLVIEILEAVQVVQI